MSSFKKRSKTKASNAHVHKSTKNDNVRKIYDFMFHGPHVQGINEIMKAGDLLARGVPESIEGYIKALKDDNSLVRSTAAGTLAEVSVDPNIKIILGRLLRLTGKYETLISLLEDISKHDNNLSTRENARLAADRIKKI